MFTGVLSDSDIKLPNLEAIGKYLTDILDKNLHEFYCQQDENEVYGDETAKKDISNEQRLSDLKNNKKVEVRYTQESQEIFKEANQAFKSKNPEKFDPDKWEIYIEAREENIKNWNTDPRELVRV